jgi:ABC-type transport system involved in cytochrome bd biosynthesis fused ATPase/permease subunit
VDRLAAIATLPKEERGEGTNLGNEVGLRMQNVSFRYEDGVNVMDDFSFDFKPCTITAVMGRTGVGKSTLMRMVLGLISPQEGEVTFYNNNEQASASALTRCNVAYVPQGNSLISGTIRSNLLLGDPKASEEQMREVLRIAIMNGGSTELALSADENFLPKGVKVRFEPSKISPKGQGFVVVEYNPTTEQSPTNLGKIYIKGLNLPPRQSAIDVVLKR